MFTGRRRRLLRSLVSSTATVAMVVSAAAFTSMGAQAAPVGQADKIKPQLMQQFEADGEASFWIRFKDSADLSGASRIKDWDRRGTAVYEALTKVAQGSQADVRRTLDEQSVTYRAFHATNAIRVDKGSEDLAATIADRPEVEALYPTRTYDKPEPIKGKDLAEVNAVEWGVADINADDVWEEYGTTGEGITVASIDTGAQFDHPALVDSYRGNNGDGSFDHNYNWYDAAGTCGDAPCDVEAHGSHTMGTMVGDDNDANQIGVAPGATWIAANGCCPTDAALIASGEWMLAPRDLTDDPATADASKRPNIINNSWGTRLPSNDPFMEDVIAAWEASGIFGSWSNGNSGPACQTSGAPGSRIITYSTGAHDVNDDIAVFSARGTGQDDEVKPNISAPGVNVRSSVPGGGYASFSGTSMAAPHVAGTIALLWSAAPSLVGDVAATRALLDDTAVDTEALECGGTADDNNVFGEGRLDALALLNAAPVGDTGNLAGTVTDASTGDPIEGATVHITGADTDRSLETGADGGYTSRLTGGDYTVTVTEFGYAEHAADVTVPAGETTTLDFALEPVPSVTVSGAVTDGSGQGWPLYAKVSVQGADESVYTRPANGRYSMSLPAGSTYTLTVETEYDGYETVTEEVEVGPGSTRHDIEVPVDTNTCLAPGYAYSYDGVGTDFNGGVLPEGWTIEDNLGNGEVWTFDDPGARGNLTGGDGAFAIIDSDAYGSGTEQDTSLVSPVADLSGQDSPIIGFRQDYNNLGDIADVDVSIDGGATWETVLHQTADDRGPVEKSVPIPQAANQAAVQVRFHYYEAGFNWWWQVDDVFVGNRSCDATGGGLVVGNVRDRNTNDGINGATVTSLDQPEETATTTATPDDPALRDGFYWLYSSLDGSHRFQAKAGSYASQNRNVDVETGWATTANFALAAGLLRVEPMDVSATMPLGDRTADRSFTVTNDGGLPAELEFSERKGEFEMLRADGSRMTQSEIATAPGAPLQELRAPVSFEAQAKSSMGSNQTATAGPAEAPWTDIADYPSVVMDNRVVTLDGTIYSIGGGNGTASSASAFVYDPATLTWDPIADLPGARNAMTVGAVNGQIVATGGWGDAGPDAATWVYDPAADSWSVGADNPTPRAAAAQAVVDGLLYAVGGCTTSACTPMSNDVVAYDPAGDTWATLADYPADVAFASCGGIDGALYCTGGNGGAGGTVDSYTYDPGTDTWSPIEDAPVDTWASSFAVANGQLVVNGGVQAGVITNATFAYDPGTGAWTDLPNSNTPRYRGGAACGYYKVGGSSGSFNATADSEVLPGYAECAAGGADVEWMSIDTTSATLAPGESVTVTVTMSADVAQPGTYTAGVGIKEDTPYTVEPVDVTMNVTPPGTWGKLAGTVTGVACDGGSSPLSGATVQVDSWATDWTFSTDAEGKYAQWIDRRANPLTVIAAKDGYKPQTDRVRVQPGETVVADFALEKAGC